MKRGTPAARRVPAEAPRLVAAFGPYRLEQAVTPCRPERGERGGRPIPQLWALPQWRDETTGRLMGSTVTTDGARAMALRAGFDFVVLNKRS